MANPRVYTKELYQKELAKAKRRIKTLMKHRAYQPLPELKGTDYRSAIKALQKIGWSKLTSRQKKTAQRRYESLYETGQLPSQYLPKITYTPPSEDDYFQGVLPEQPEEPEIEEDYAVSWEEIGAELDSLIDSIVEQSGGDLTKPETGLGKYLRENLRNTIDNFIYSALDGSRETFYRMLENTDYLNKLQQAAYRYLRYLSKTEYRGRYQEESFNAYNDFIDALNSY